MYDVSVVFHIWLKKKKKKNIMVPVVLHAFPLNPALVNNKCIYTSYSDI